MKSVTEPPTIRDYLPFVWLAFVIVIIPTVLESLRAVFRRRRA